MEQGCHPQRLQLAGRYRPLLLQVEQASAARAQYSGDMQLPYRCMQPGLADRSYLLKALLHSCASLQELRRQFNQHNLLVGVWPAPSVCGMVADSLVRGCVQVLELLGCGCSRPLLDIPIFTQPLCEKGVGLQAYIQRF